MKDSMMTNHSHPFPLESEVTYLNILSNIALYRTIYFLLAGLSNTTTFLSIFGLYRQNFLLRLPIFLSLFISNILVTYTLILLQPVILFPTATIYILGPLPISPKLQLTFYSILLILSLAAAAYSIIFTYCAAVLRNQFWQKITIIVIFVLVLIFCTFNSYIFWKCNTTKVLSYSAVIFTKSQLNMLFVEFLVLLLFGGGIVSFSVERTLSFINSVNNVKQRTAALQFSVLKLIISYGIIFIVVFAIPALFMFMLFYTSSATFSKLPLLFLAVVIPSALVCPAVFLANFRYVKQFRVAIAGRTDVISPLK